MTLPHDDDRADESDDHDDPGMKSDGPGATQPPDEDQRWAEIVADLRRDPALRSPMPPPRTLDPVIDELLDDGSFVPDEPPPLRLPRTRLARFGWTAAIGGPVLALLSRVVSLPTAITGIGVLIGIAGFVVLVAGLPDRRSDDGDGAVV